MRFIADGEVAYAAQRSREVHDLWHVLFGCHTNVFGELALKAVEYVQVGKVGRRRQRCGSTDEPMVALQQVMQSTLDECQCLTKHCDFHKHAWDDMCRSDVILTIVSSVMGAQRWLQPQDCWRLSPFLLHLQHCC